MLRIAGRRFSTISAAYANAVSKQLIKEDACQLNVVRYLDRFQRVIESYHRGPIPNYEIVKLVDGRPLSCGVYDEEEEAKQDLLYFGKNDPKSSEYYIKPYLEPTTLSSSVQKRKVVTSSINHFPRLPTEVSRYRTYSQFNHTWKQPKAESQPAAPSPAEESAPQSSHLSYKKLLELTKSNPLPDRRGVMSPIPRVPRGIYLYGDVGTGKSYLMDLFYATCSVNGGKCRVHFHEFMQDFHRQIHDYKENQIEHGGRESHLHLTSEKDAIVQVAKRIALKNTLICFDEFHVTDIADALILSHIFETFFKAGSVVFTTSNHAPENLYQNGLNRFFFLPFISLIKSHSRVIDIASAVDYRRSLAHRVDDVVLTPCGPAADAVLYGMFPQLRPGTGKPFNLALSATRHIAIPAAVDGVCRIPFSMICEDDRGTDDYEQIAKAFHTVVITDIPQFDVGQPNILSRFVKMIDQFYDHRTRVIVTAQTDVDHLFDRVFDKERAIQKELADKETDLMQQGRLAAISSLVFSCKRTQSRLLEMTGKEYLDRHAEEHDGWCVCSQTGQSHCTRTTITLSNGMWFYGEAGREGVPQ